MLELADLARIETANFREAMIEMNGADEMKGENGVNNDVMKWKPYHFLIAVLLTISCVEAVVMLLLPYLLPATVSGLGEAASDALLLAAMSTPILWFVVFRPLHQKADQQKGRADSIINAASDPIITVSSDGFIRSFNPGAEQFFGYSEQEILHGNVAVLLPSPQREEYACYVADRDKKNNNLNQEIVVQHKDGTIIPVHLSVSQFFDVNEGSMFMGILRDLTANKKIENELIRAKKLAEAASRSKSDFLSNMSHEIRTPLNGIIGFTDLLLQEENVFGEEERSEFLSDIQASGKHLLSLINGILDLSKIESGKLELEIVDQSPHSLLSDVVSMMRVRAGEKNLRLDYHWSGPLPRSVRTDPTRLRQLLVNLIGNAIKFTDQGSVRIVAQLDQVEKPHRLRFDIIDTGIGIPEDKLETIFSAFSQADNTVTRKYGGTGLGLAISRRLAQALGGDLTVASKEGAGATFTATIGVGEIHPACLLSSPPADGIASQEPADVLPDKGTLPNIRVLLVEDGDINRKLIIALLNQAGISIVDTAENGEQGLKIAIANPFDLVLLDMQMPVMDGYSAAAAMREAGIEVPIIALTAHVMKGDREKCLEAGCSDYLAKPIVAKDLFSKIRHCYSDANSEIEIVVG